MVGVAEPAVPVVPVTHASDVLGQRGGGRGDDAAGRPVGERLQGDQRPDDGLAVGALIGAARHPLVPELPGLLQGTRGIQVRRLTVVRGNVSEHEGNDVARGHGERRRVGQALPGQVHRRAQPDRVRARGGPDTALGLGDPRHDGPVAEAQRQPDSHVDGPAHAPHQADQHGGFAVFAWRHEIGHFGDAGRRFPPGLQDQRLAGVPPAGRGLARGGDLPGAMVPGAQEGREAGLRVEARQTQPVHRTVRADQRDRLHVTDDGVVFDPARHMSSRVGVHCRYGTRRSVPVGWHRAGTTRCSRR